MRRVLVVDDDALMRDLFTAVLKRAKFEVACAVSREQGLAHVRAFPADLVLVDVQLGPGGDGLALAREIAGFPAFEDVPIIALSATHGGDIERRAHAAGCAGFIGKPINPRTFAEQIAHYVSKRPKPVNAHACAEDAFAHMKRAFVARAIREVAELAARSDEELFADQALEAAAHRWAGASGLDGLPDVLGLALSLERLARKKQTSELTRVRAELALVGGRYRASQN